MNLHHKGITIKSNLVRPKKYNKNKDIEALYNSMEKQMHEFKLQHAYTHAPSAR